MPDKFSFISSYAALIQDSFLTGSRILGGSTEDSDYDVCVLAEFGLIDALLKDGWTVSVDSDDYPDLDEYPFWTARRGDQNIIAYDNAFGFLIFRAAHLAALHMKVTGREARKALFQAVCTGMSAF